MSHLLTISDLTIAFTGDTGTHEVTDHLSLTLDEGEVVCLVGESGCGKSVTSMSLLGLLGPGGSVTEGSICYEDRDLLTLSEKELDQIRGKEISMIFQDPMSSLNPVFTIGYQIMEGLRIHLGLKKREAWVRAVELLDRVGMKEPEMAMKSYPHTLSGGMRQRAIIAMALACNPKLLIADEPTTALDVTIQRQIIELLRTLQKKRRMSILFITHKLNEIMEVADRCTILRKGKYVGTVNVKDTTKEELSKMMVGRNVNFSVDKKPAKPGETVLKVEHMTVPSKAHSNNAVKDISFNVRRGEIVCIAGIDGNGQSEFVQGLTGLEKITGGKILFKGQDITKASIRERSKMGMSHIPEDRHKHGLVLDYSLEQNMVLQRYFEPDFQKGGFIKSKEVRRYADKLIEQYDVRSGQGPITITRSMSGGNQQKAIIAREIDKDPDLLVAVQPTRGLDVGAIEYIHSQLVAQRDKGKAVLLVSLELDEVMDVSDRILVMYEGELVGQLDPKQITVEELGLYMAGAKKEAVPEEV